jgi:ABC-2 type transport system permease protein
MRTDVIWLTAQQLLTRGKLLTLAGVVALPPFLALLYRASGSETAPERFLSRLCDGLVLTTVLPVLALVFGGAALGNEAEDGTLSYLLMKPSPRWAIVAAKLIASLVIVASLTVLSVLLATVVAGRDGVTLRLGLAFAAGATAGALGYTAAFLFLGLITSRTLIVGLLYVFLWEGALTALFPGLRALSIRQYSRGIADALAGVPANVLDVKISTGAALFGMLAVTLVCFLLTTRRLEVMDIE